MLQIRLKITFSKHLILQNKFSSYTIRRAMEQIMSTTPKHNLVFYSSFNI